MATFDPLEISSAHLTSKSFPATWVNLRTLLWKSTRVFARNKLSTFLQITCPVFICAYLLCIQLVVDTYVESTGDKHPPTHSVEIPKCWGTGCVTLAVVLAGPPTDWTDFVIPHISQQTGLTLGKDLVVYEQSSLAFLHDLKKNSNRTQTGLVLCTEDYILPQNPITDRIPALHSTQRVSNENVDYFEPAAIGTKLAIDNALLAYAQSSQLYSSSTQIKAEYQSFPQPMNRFLKGYNVVSMQGQFYFFIPPMVLFGMAVIEIVKEKEAKLRQGLLVTGVSNFEFWASWFFVVLALVLISSNIQIFAGYAFLYDFFLKTPYLYDLYRILLLTFTVFGMSMMMIGFFITTLLTTIQSAYTTSYAFLLVGFVFQMFFADTSLVRLIFSESLPGWALWVKYLLSLYPPFSLALLLTDISGKSSPQFNGKSNMWKPSRGYTWTNFVSSRSGTIAGNPYWIPPPLLSLTIIVLDSLFYMLLAWYFDHVLASNRGARAPLCFFLQKKYWRRRKRCVDNGQSMMDLTAAKGGLVLDNIEKVYSNGLIRKRRTHAVCPLQLSVSQNQLLGLIGHNGAGKTTLLRMLTGLLTPTSGTAWLNGLNLVEEFDLIAPQIGYCPQHDILWEELTAREHLWMFSRFKGVPQQEIHQCIDEVLRQIVLQDDADTPVGDFSGGMKRRLSVGIASIGSPSIIFLNEPTTGMDPIAKRLVWGLIKDLKPGKVVVLTTHSMEEADILADCIAVMVDGEIKSTGTSLSLKNNYGEGYKLDLVTEYPAAVWHSILQQFPHVHLLDESAGSLVITLPQGDLKQVELFLTAIETGQFPVREWAISNSSLEEVFMKLTDKKQTAYVE